MGGRGLHTEAEQGTGLLGSPGLASSPLNRSRPVLQQWSRARPHLRSAHSVPLPVSQGEVVYFPLANTTLKGILHPPEKATEKERHCAQVLSLHSLPWGPGVGWVGAPVFIFLTE